MVECLQCGYRNQLGHMFCLQCGAKLKLKTHADTEMLGLAKTRRFGLKHVVLLIIVLAMAVIGLLLWPARSIRGDATSTDFKWACRKIDVLQSGVSTRPQVLTENEVNMYMAAVVARAKKSIGSGGLSVRIRSVYVTFKPEVMALTVTKTWGPLALGPLKLGPVESTYGLTGVPEVGESGFRFRVKRGQIGHFPLPGALCEPALSEAVTFFSRLKMERAFLDRIDNMEIAEGMITVSMKR